MKKLFVIAVPALFSACTTVTYPNGTTVTTPYVAPAYAPAYAPVYAAPEYAVPVASYSIPLIPGAYYGYGAGCAPLLGFGWGNWGRWWGGGCNGWNNNHWNGGYGGCYHYNTWNACNVYRGYSGYRGYRYGR